MQKILFIICLSAFYISTSTAIAANTVVVVPLAKSSSKAEGNATPRDVLIGKTFSSDTGVGITGTRPIAPFAKTGQTTSYATGDDGDLEKGVAWPTPRFTDNNDGTVTDNLTSLIWLQFAFCKDTVAGINNSTGLLPWFYALTWTNGLENGFCGLTDSSTAGVWRLPNKKELESLLDFAYFSPALSNDVGTGHWQEDETSAFTNVVSTGYWTSTSYVGDAGNAWYVHLLSGALIGSTKAGGHGVWPVRD